jgi:succinate dehydrogenase hydrophobic anchor subunit
MSTQFSSTECVLARERPIAFVLRRAYLFASGLALVSLVFQLVVPSWMGEPGPGHMLFVSVVSGILSALMLLLLARRTQHFARGADDSLHTEPQPAPSLWARRLLVWIVVILIPVAIIQFCPGSP